MTDEQNYTPSQVIESPGPTSENPSITPEPPKEEPKPAKMSAEDAISKAFDDAGAKDDGAEDDKAPTKAEKPVEAKEVKPAKAEKSLEKDPSNEAATSEQEEADGRAGKTKRELRSESLLDPPPAPSRFTPSAKEKWVNTPQAVKFEISRYMQETEQEIAQYREHKQFREELKEFEDLAKKHNVPFKQVLSNYVDIERKFSEDPATGFKQLFNNLGMSPTQAVGHILRAFNATPQQLIEHITKAPHEYTQLAQQRMQAPQPQQPTNVPDPRIQQLEERLAALDAEKVANNVIAPFAEEYPEYYEHEDQIAKVLQSGIIEQIHGNGLSPRDKLEIALGMVAPHALKRSSQSQEESRQQVPVPAARDTSPVVDLRGTKSIKGAPHGVQTDRRGKMSKEDAINEAMARFGS